ncbi:MAG: 50S ribosome-binding GTPase [Alphaproteobacteria bacterium]|nr:50S ribosome-binding GTPase [Alphaproteobacteria bacterium]
MADEALPFNGYGYIGARLWELADEQIKKAFKAWKGHSIIVIGYTGGGKSALLNNVLQARLSAPDAGTIRPEEVLGKISGKSYMLIDTPGNEGFFPFVEPLLVRLENRQLLGVINVVSFGYNESYASNAGDRNQHTPYLFNANATVNRDYLEEERRREIKYLDLWLNKCIVRQEKIGWIFTVINKADLWHAEADKVMSYYGPDGDYGSIVVSAVGKNRYSSALVCARQGLFFDNQPRAAQGFDGRAAMNGEFTSKLQRFIEGLKK